MTIDKIHDVLDLVSEKERGVYFTPEQKDTALDFGSLELFNQNLPTYGTSEVSKETLSPFKVPFQINNGNSPSGLITLPNEFEFLSGIFKIGFDNKTGETTYQPIELLNEDELADRLKSFMMKPTVNKPIAERVGRYQVQLYPKVPNAGMIFYLKRPTAPKFAYTEGGTDNRDIQYVSASSSQMEWNEYNIYKVIIKALSILGINMDEEKLVQYSKMLEKDNA